MLETFNNYSIFSPSASEYTDITVDIYHIYHRPGNSNLPGFLHGIQHKPTDPQPLPGPGGLSGNPGHLGDPAYGEVQLPHQRGKRLWE